MPGTVVKPSNLDNSDLISDQLPGPSSLANPFAANYPIAPIRVKIAGGIGTIVEEDEERERTMESGSDEEDERPFFPGKPTARSYRTIGLPKPKAPLLKMKANFKWPVCAGCQKSWNMSSEINRWVTCDICNDNFHLQCSGLQYEPKDKWADIEEFECENCKELSGGV